jgi:hypothetical protein
VPDVPMISPSNGKDNSAARPFSDFHAECVGSGKGGFEVIDSVELAARWQVPETWIRSHPRVRHTRRKTASPACALAASGRD